MSRPDTTDYRTIFLQDLPLLDVRAPIEFVLGAFPQAVNLPLLDNSQRERIGIRYKEAGQDAAIALGLELATPALRAERLAAWTTFCQRHRSGYLYCFRGGLRSRTTQSWLREQGVDYPLVIGGYKALRRFLLEELERALGTLPLLVLGGNTGSGKTALLRQHSPHIDLEGRARHRGSAFGSLLIPQPAQIDWENAIAIDLLKHGSGPLAQRPLLLEDEGRLIGNIWLPQLLQDHLRQAPLVILEASIEERTASIREDYIDRQWQTCLAAHGAEARAVFSRFVLDNLARIRKRLGGARYQALQAEFTGALHTLFAGGGSAAFEPGIARLLHEYYDPMYQHQLQSRQRRIVFRGQRGEVLAWLQDLRELPA